MLAGYDHLSGASKRAKHSLAEEKTERSSLVLIFLGIALDTLWQSSRLPGDKLVDLKHRLRDLLPRKKVSLKNLQEVVGHLKFTCKVVAPGWVFLWRLCKTVKDLSRPHHWRQFSAGMKKDLWAWLQFLMSFNVVSFWRTDLCLGVVFQVQIHNTGSLGYGLYFQGRWCASLATRVDKGKNYVGSDFPGILSNSRSLVIVDWCMGELCTHLLVW